MNAPPNRNLTRPPTDRHGFSLTELLVVIGIIVLLVGLLLVALGGVRTKAKRAQSESTMRSLSQASESFQMEQGEYPGVIPEFILEQNPGVITSTENALLHLMGGYRVLPPDAGVQTEQEYDNYEGDVYTFTTSGDDWKLKVNRNLVGEGPLINNKPFAPYLTPAAREIAIAEGQVQSSSAGGFGGAKPLPDLVDSWGQPLLYARRLRSIGNVVGTPSAAQYTLAGQEGYLQSNRLGDLGADQVYHPSNNPGGSILSEGGNLGSAGMCADGNATIRECNFWKILEHPALVGEPRGAFAIFSAGKDGVYFSAQDGPSEEGMAETDIFDMAPTVLDEYDDIRIFGGG